MIKDASKEDVEFHLGSGKVILDVWKNGCPPCSRMEPIFSKLDEEINDVLFIKVKADDNMDYVASDLKVRNAPTFILFNNGEEVKRISGYVSEVELRNFIEE